MDDDDFIVGARKNIDCKKNKLENFIIRPEKYEFDMCVKSFLNHFIREMNVEHMINLCFTGDIESLYIRPTLWKIFLCSIPLNRDYNQWIDEVTTKRNNFKDKLKAYNNYRKIAGDPLGGVVQNNEGWNSFFKDNELKKLITLDISRTYQDKELFQNSIIKEQLTLILFIWSKENIQVSYRQGMNEILAVFLLAMYPFYNTNSKVSDENLKEKIRVSKEKNDLNSVAKDLYMFLYHESELQADLFILFDALMSRGIISLYSVENEERKNENFAGKKKDLFHIQYKDETPLKLENTSSIQEISSLQKRCNKISKEFLRIVDPELYNYLIEIDIDATIILVRWLKCILNREFPPRSVIIIWDTILAFDIKEKLDLNQHKNIELFNLNMLDFVCVAMLTHIREEILRKDNVECLQRLFKYPSVDDPITLIKIALNIKEIIYRKILKIKEKIKNNSEKQISIVTTDQTLNLNLSDSVNKIVKKLKCLIDKYKPQIKENDMKEINEIIKNIS